VTIAREGLSRRQSLDRSEGSLLLPRSLLQFPQPLSFAAISRGRAAPSTTGFIFRH
jgi:hypothetical protein